jgi:protein-S-isoprenylcysteine O-methyltransferase Ste14
MDKTSVRIIGAVIMALLVIASTFLESSLRMFIGIGAAMISVVLLVISRIQLGDSFAVRPKAKALVTSGMYSKILHPMYLFLDLFIASIIVIIDMPVLLIVLGILVAVQIIRMKKEEKVLTEAFGDEYIKYKEQTWV